MNRSTSKWSITLLITLSTFLITFSVNADSYSLLDLSKISLANNLEFEEAAIETLIAREKTKQAKSALKPKIYIEANYAIDDDPTTTISGAQSGNNLIDSNTDFISRSNSNIETNASNEVSISSTSGTSNSSTTENIETDFNTSIKTSNDDDSIGLKVEIPLWDREKKYTKILSSMEEVQFSTREKIKQYKILKSVTQSYFEILRLQSLFDNLTSEIEVNLELIDLTKQVHQAGEAINTDTLELEIELLKKKSSLQTINLKIDQQRILLGGLIGKELSRELVLKPFISTELPLLMSMDKYIEKNIIKNHELELKHQLIESSAVEVKRVRAKKWPKINSTLQYNFDKDITKTVSISQSSTDTTSNTSTDSRVTSVSQSSDDSSSTHSTTSTVGTNSTISNEGFANTTRSRSELEGERYRIMFTLRVPLYFGGQVKSKINESILKHQRALTRQTKVFDNLVMKARNLWTEAKSELKTIEFFDLAIAKQTDLIEANLVRFQSGLGSKIDVLEAQKSLFQLESMQINSTYNYLEKLISLRFDTNGNSYNNLVYFDSFLE